MKCFRKLIICLLAVIIVLPFGIFTASAFDYREVVKDSKASVNYEDDGETVGIDQTQRKTTDYTGYTSYTNPGEQNVNVRATQHTTYNATVPAILIVDGAFRPNSTNGFAYEVAVEGNLAGDVQVLLEPDADFTLSSVGKEDIPATIAQEKTKFTYEDGVRINTPVVAEGSGAVNDMTAGLWFGSWNYNIRLLPIYDMEDFEWLDDDYTTGVVTAISDIGTEKLETYGIMIFPEAGAEEGFEGVKAFNTQDSNLFANVQRDDSEIFIPSTVERIEDGKLNTNGPFYMAKASKITFEQPSQLKYIGRYAFCYSSIKEPITIPASVEELGYRSFNCINYNSANMNAKKYMPLYIEEGSQLKRIGDNAFSYSLFSGTLKLPETLETIEKEAFQHCFFSEIQIPDTVKTIGSNAFDTCKDKKGNCELNIPNYVESWANAYSRCYDVTITIPDTIKVIPAGAFSNTYIKTINIPAGVEKIDRYAFSSSLLTSITFPNTLKEIGYQAFYGTSLTKLVIPNSVEIIDEYAFRNLNALSEVTIGSGLQSSYDIGLSSCKLFKTITFKGLNRIPENICLNCVNLETVNIESPLTAIGDKAFDGCTKIKSTNFTGTIDEWLAVDMEGLRSDPTYYPKNLKINGSFVTSLNFAPNPDEYQVYGRGKFVAWTALTRVTIKSGVETLSSHMFDSCTQLSSVSLPSTLKQIGSSCFYNCKNLKYISLPSNLEYIGQTAFCGTGLTSVIVPDSVSFMEQGVFRDCTSLTSAKLKVVNNAESCFYNCSSLTSITLEEGTTYLPNQFASYCPKLTSINIPESLTYVGSYPFRSSGLSSLEWHLSNNVTTIQSGAFEGTAGKIYIDNYPGSISGYPWYVSNYSTRIVWLREAE